jgi:hypothetical protein
MTAATCDLSTGVSIEVGRLTVERVAHSVILVIVNSPNFHQTFWMFSLEVVKYFELVSVIGGGQMRLGHGQSDSVGNSLSQGTRTDFDA